MLPNALKLIVLATVFAVAGCSDGPAAKEETQDTDPVPPDRTAYAPNLIAGASFTYKTLGYWDAVGSITIVALPTEDGYLFAGEEYLDLVDEVAWDRPYFGAVNADFTGGSTPFLQFPIENGTSWTVAGVTVTAAYDTLQYNDLPGYVIRGADGMHTVHMEYAPSLGHVTYFASSMDGEVHYGLQLESTGVASTYAYPVRQNEVIGNALPEVPETLAVSADDAHVLLWGLASADGRGQVVSPKGGLWGVDGSVDYAYDLRPAEPGDWHISGAATDASGWSYIQAHALQWLEGDVADWAG